MNEFLSWIELHPTLVDAIATILTGMLATVAGLFAFYGAVAQAKIGFRGAVKQAQAVEKQTKATQEWERTQLDEKQKAKIATLAAEIRDLVNRVLSIRAGVADTRRMSPTAEHFLSRTIVFSHNPAIISSLGGPLAAKIVRFYSMIHMQQISVSHFTDRDLSDDHLYYHVKMFMDIAIMGFGILGVLQEDYNIFPDHYEWSRTNQLSMHALKITPKVDPSV
ncbi:hypothetical protein [Thalassospira xiamenensis]|uniref:hypothetical protein n=1 Tax=Thalassospira xiamenensis TaxID=220697 RepID=UPI001FFE3C04|nr:hypothetical protein [Thalassospira xiamenensis]MCK2165104.1 hypothetical protein [Thalassospira xiamenensis]